VIHLEIGEPDFPTPAPVIEAAATRDRGRAISYTRRRSGCLAFAPRSPHTTPRHYGVDVDPDRVIVTAGSSAALLLVMALIVNRTSASFLAIPAIRARAISCACSKARPLAFRSGRHRTISSRQSSSIALDAGHARRIDIASPSQSDGYDNRA